MRKLSGSLGLVVVFFLIGCSAGDVPNITSKSMLPSCGLAGCRSWGSASDNRCRA